MTYWGDCMNKIKKTLVKAKLLKNENIYINTYKQTYFIGEIANVIKPMQFCSLYVGKGEMILPRPISIFNVDKEAQTLDIVFFTIGKGTEALSELTPNSTVDMLLPLGNGFSEFDNINRIALVGGGIGIPPLYYLAKEIKKYNKDIIIDIYLGYRNEAFLLDYFNEFNTFISSDTDKKYFNGNVISLMRDKNLQYDKVVSCGPTVMLKSLSEYCEEKNFDLSISLEERMACSIGACVGCVVKIKTDVGLKNKKVCVDGPVFNSKVVAFNE